MTNAGLKEAIAQMGERLCIIRCDNAEHILIGYPNSRIKIDEKGNRMFVTDEKTKKKIPVPADTISVNDIEYHNFGGEDFFSVVLEYTSQVPHYKYRVYHRTDAIQTFLVVEPGFENCRIDPAAHIR